MKTLVYTSSLGLLTMVLEMLNLRRFVLPVAVLGLAVIFGLNMQSWGVNHPSYSGMVLIDNYSVAFSGILILLTALILLWRVTFTKTNKAKFPTTCHCSYSPCAALWPWFRFGNLAMFFLGLEVLSISLYVLAGSKKGDLKSHEAGMKYFLMGSFASGILLFGIALVYGETGSFNIFNIGHFSSTACIRCAVAVGRGPYFNCTAV